MKPMITLIGFLHNILGKKVKLDWNYVKGLTCPKCGAKSRSILFHGTGKVEAVFECETWMGGSDINSLKFEVDGYRTQCYKKKLPIIKLMINKLRVLNKNTMILDLEHSNGVTCPFCHNARFRSICFRTDKQLVIAVYNCKQWTEGPNLDSLKNKVGGVITYIW